MHDLKYKLNLLNRLNIAADLLYSTLSDESDLLKSWIASGRVCSE